MRPVLEFQLGHLLLRHSSKGWVPSETDLDLVGLTVAGLISANAYETLTIFQAELQTGIALDLLHSYTKSW